jgi:hypothetical protein
MYVSEGLRGAAEKSWSVAIVGNGGEESAADAGNGEDGKKRTDGKSESCIVS